MIGLFFLMYLFLRADTLSMTIDESSTCDVADASGRDIMFSKHLFNSANNHILNSLLLKKSVEVFGWHEWSIRLPNVLAFIVYFFACLLIMNRLSSDYLIRLAGLIIFCSPHYLLDYFSLARGYGIAVAFEMMALFFFIQYFSIHKRVMLLYAFGFIALASYANFTWLNVLVGMFVVVNISVLMDIGKPFRFNQLLSRLLYINLYPVIISIIFFVLSYKPISFLKGKDEFKWGAETWAASMHSFVNNLHYSQSGFLLSQDVRILLIKLFLVISIVVAGVISAKYFSQWRNEKPTAFKDQQLVISLLLLLVIICSTICQQYLIHTNYIDGRKALLYVPVILLLLTGTLSWLTTYKKSYGKVAWFSFCTICSIHFVSIFNFKSCNEWWFDATSKSAYLYIVNDSSAVPKQTAVNWLFFPSINLYNYRFYGGAIPSLSKTNEIQNFDSINYVYVIGDEIRTIPPVFKPVKRYLWDRFILKKDTAAYKTEVAQFIMNERKKLTGADFAELYWRQKADSFLLKQRTEMNWAALLYSE